MGRRSRKLLGRDSGGVRISLEAVLNSEQCVRGVPEAIELKRQLGAGLSAMAYATAPAALLGRLRVLAPAADDQLDDDPAIVGSIRWLLFSGQHDVC